MLTKQERNMTPEENKKLFAAYLNMARQKENIKKTLYFNINSMTTKTK
jgi:hypothetical protein